MLQLVLKDGRLALNISNVDCQLKIGNYLNDGDWHDVRLFVQDGSVAANFESIISVKHYGI